MNENITSPGNDLSDAVAEVRSAALDAETLVMVAHSDERKITQDALRQRAAAERERGRVALARRSTGLAVLEEKVIINERVAGASFERFFPTIETAIYVISNKGHFFISPKQVDEVMAQVETSVSEMEQKTLVRLAEVTAKTDIIKNSAGFLKPTYSKPATDQMVELKTKLAARVLRIFTQHDAILCALQVLHWNDEVSKEEVAEQERDMKVALTKFARFFQGTLRGLKKKAEKVEQGIVKDESEPDTLKVAA